MIQAIPQAKTIIAIPAYINGLCDSPVDGMLVLELVFVLVSGVLGAVTVRVVATELSVKLTTILCVPALNDLR